jgi:hypothetical protein
MNAAFRTTTRIHPHREANAIATLTLAFATDPANRWCWPTTGVFLEAFPAFARAFGDAPSRAQAALKSATAPAWHCGCHPALSPMKRR